MTRRFPARLVLILLLLIAAAGIDGFRPSGNFSVSHVSYDFRTLAPLDINTPANQASAVHLSFDAFTPDLSVQRNLVQVSGNSGPTFEFILQPHGHLIWEAFGIGAVPVTLADNLALKRWHHLAIDASPSEFDMSVDGRHTHIAMTAVHQIQSSAQIGATDFTLRASRIEIGAGSTAQILFPGRIADLALRTTYVKLVPAPLAALGGFLVAGALLWMLWPILLTIEAPSVCVSDLAILAIVVLTALAGLAADAFSPAAKWAVLLAPGAGAIAAILWAVRTKSTAIPSRGAGALTLVLCLLLSASLMALPNWLAAERMFERWPLTSAFVFIATLSAALFVLQASARVTGGTRAPRWIAWAPYVMFAFLALRTDSLFQPINALHWEYFVGPIRAVHEGGWLLWGVPSQYGFLNVLISSIVPARTAVDSFYWFQGVVFFAASSLFYRTMRETLGVHWFVAAAIVAAFFFLADPLLIGPMAYPSMGAVRFLWCYVLLALAAANFLGAQPSIERYSRHALPVWLLGALWSAEGAVYVSVIYFAPILAHLVRLQSEKVPVRAIVRKALGFFVPVLLLAILAFATIELAYLAALGHGADWSMFIAYARSYGSGFGELPVPIDGPVWLLAAILFAGVAMIAVLRRKGAAGAEYAVVTAMATVWIVSTYYVGRAFAVVITDLSPLFVFAIFIIVRAGRGAAASPLLAFLAAPFLALGIFSSFFNANAPLVLPSWPRETFTASSRLPKADAELASVLRTARISPETAVVYYDSWVAMPRSDDGPYEHNWLPTPLQDLDTPIPPPVRQKIVERFVARHRLSGYFIEGLGGYNSPENAESWKTLLSSYYDVLPVSRSPHYALYRFSLRPHPGVSQ